LKKQRFRWCFGGIQILKKHWESLMPWAHWVNPDNRLTYAQRYFYLVGSLQWFTDLLNLIFAFFLVLGGIFSLLGGQNTIRPLTSTLMILPAIFLFLGLWRFVWVLRHKLHLSWFVAFRSMYSFFSLGWVVALACIQGWIQNKGVFLRTPKTRSASKMLRAFSVTRWETLIGLICVGTGILAFLAHPEIRTLFLGFLLVWQSSLYLSAPYYSLLSVREKPGRQRAERGAPVSENRAARLAFAMVIILVIGASMVLWLPRPEGTPAYVRFLPIEVPIKSLFGIERVPIEERGNDLPPGVTGTPTGTSVPSSDPRLTPTAIRTPTLVVSTPTFPFISPTDESSTSVKRDSRTGR
jgi:hypothetical protein